MRTLYKTTVTFGAALLFVNLVLAQALTTPIYGLAGLVPQPGVMKELKLTDKQVDQSKKAAQAVTEKHKDELAQLETLQGNEKAKKATELSKLIAEESNAALARVLSADQIKRLKEIRIQQKGIFAFGETEVTGALKLSTEQSKKLRAVNKEYQTAMLAASKLSTAAEKAQAANAAIKDAMAKAVELLDDTQKKAWKELTGEPYQGR